MVEYSECEWSDDTTTAVAAVGVVVVFKVVVGCVSVADATLARITAIGGMLPRHVLNLGVLAVGDIQFCLAVGMHVRRSLDATSAR